MTRGRSLRDKLLFTRHGEKLDGQVMRLDPKVKDVICELKRRVGVFTEAIWNIETETENEEESIIMLDSEIDLSQLDIDLEVSAAIAELRRRIDVLREEYLHLTKTI